MSQPPQVAFADPKLPPTPEAVVETIGQEAYAEVAKLYAWLDSAHRDISREWKYSTASGWYEIPTLKDRRVFYFIPKPGDFRLNIVVGEKALAALTTTPHARRVATLLKTAKRYPEGTMFAFDAQSLDANLAIALIRAKLAR